NFKDLISKSIVEKNKHIKTVLRIASPVSSNFRLRKYEWILGEKKTETIHKEFGCIFKVDLSKVYFSPRLHYERMRIAKQVKSNETIINMFAGIGCFSIIIAKHSKVANIYSIDINPYAIIYHLENVYLNKLNRKIITILGDSKKIIATLLLGKADRVLMPLPEKAYEYLDIAVKALKANKGIIHYYDFVYARKNKEDPKEKVIKKISLRAKELSLGLEVFGKRIVRSVGPNWYQVVLDLNVFPR
ncbi:MAG: class I SAM-dependent methyltransferase family protein, partial [Candidatus Bathyarchaeia archaeon]